MCTMCTKCTLACRGGEECRFVSRLPRERRHAACVDVKRRLHGAWWRAPGGREGLVDTPPLFSIHYRLSGRRSYASPPSATLSVCLCAPVGSCLVLSLVCSVGSPLATCALPKGVYYLNLTLYTIRYAERSAGFLRLRALRFLQSTVAREDGLSVSFRQLYVNLTEP